MRDNTEGTTQTERDTIEGINRNKLTSREKYEVPKIKVMDEAEMLAAFQVTAGGTVSWWSM
jgi:hypothetical protein